MPFVHAFLFIFNAIISLVILLVFANAILSWLITFDVVNVRNPTVYQIVRALDAFVDPMLRPIRRFLPNLGGIDVSPVILLILLYALRMLVNELVAPYAVAGVALS